MLSAWFLIMDSLKRVRISRRSERLVIVDVDSTKDRLDNVADRDVYAIMKR